jgi:glycosyltransferase involved in cell wall biosynthesis
MIILTTTYNCENFVERSLLTIMTQRFKDFKCYITDDMSTDNTVDIIKKNILQVPPSGSINVHPSLLPKLNGHGRAWLQEFAIAFPC